MTQAPPPADLKIQRIAPRCAHRCPPAGRGLADRCCPTARPGRHAAQRHRRQRHVARRRSSSTSTWTEDGERGRGSTSPASRRRPTSSRSSRTTRCRTSTTRCGSSASDRRAGAGRRAGRADRRGARHAVLPDGPDRRRRAAGRAAVQLVGDNWLPTPRREDQRRLQDNTVKVLAGLHAIPDAADDLRLPRPPARYAGRDAARAQPRLGARLVRVGRPRPRPLADGRAGARLARGQRAGHRDRHRAVLGRLAGSAT